MVFIASRSTPRSGVSHVHKARETAPAPRVSRDPEGGRAGPRWQLRLYIAGTSVRSINALANIERICREHLERRCRIEVIDLRVHPARACEDQIVAVPSLVRAYPGPTKTMLGDLSDERRILAWLEARGPGD